MKYVVSSGSILRLKSRFDPIRCTRRSMKAEKRFFASLDPLLLEFGGKVNLEENRTVRFTHLTRLECRRQVLARPASGPAYDNQTTLVSSLYTSLPIAAFALCNVAGVRAGQASWIPRWILSTFFGSGHDGDLRFEWLRPVTFLGMVNRDDIREDFRTRDLGKSLWPYSGRIWTNSHATGTFVHSG
jgi:hypothetical protein